MEDRAAKIINDFALLSSWEEKYEYLIEFGREMPCIEENFKTDEYLIRGCQSKVWLSCEYNNKKLYFYADSDALITKGIVALIVNLYSGAVPKEILKETQDVFSIIGLREHLSMTRLNGLSIMIQTIKQYAIKYTDYD